jgi:hypothetical protein
MHLLRCVYEDLVDHVAELTVQEGNQIESRFLMHK